MGPLAERPGRVDRGGLRPTEPIDLLGFSMGGVIGRTWIQEAGGHRRTRRFYLCGQAPAQGTPLAQICPFTGCWWNCRTQTGGSPLLPQASMPISVPRSGRHCRSFYTPTARSWCGWRGACLWGPRTALPR